MQLSVGTTVVSGLIIGAMTDVLPDTPVVLSVMGALCILAVRSARPLHGESIKDYYYYEESAKNKQCFIDKLLGLRDSSTTVVE